jgi:hypothetical protein
MKGSKLQKAVQMWRRRWRNGRKSGDSGKRIEKY